jgi:flagellar basal-body rod protein FlgB
MANQDALFGIHAAAMQFQSRRMELISANIANADTPGFQARDLDFAQALKQAAEASLPAAGALAETQPAHLDADGSASTALSAGLVYRTPLQPSADGNTVDLHTEQAAFADAAIHYKASMSFVEGRLRSIMTALTGE